MLTTKSAIGLATIALVAVSCGGGSKEATITTLAPTTVPTTDAATTTTSSTVAPAASTTTEVSPPTTTLPYILREPLTGEPLASIDDLDLRPILAVKIDNHPAARKNHSGLAVADLVFEEKVEGSITRFAALFHSTGADPVGPIRSGRSQDVDLLTSFSAPLMAWSGGNPGVTQLIRNSLLTDLNAQRNSGSYFRGPGGSPHNFYSTTDSLWALTPDDHPGPGFPQFEYVRDGGVFSGEDVSGLDLSIGSYDISWEWNDEVGKFERSQNGSRHVDKTYGQIGAKNVIVMVVKYIPSTIDAASPEAQTVGEGPVTVFSDGRFVTGRWMRESSLYPIQLVDEQGVPILLTPGQTWIELAEAISTGDPANPDVDLTVRH